MKSATKKNTASQERGVTRPGWREELLTGPWQGLSLQTPVEVGKWGAFQVQATARRGVFCVIFH